MVPFFMIPLDLYNVCTIFQNSTCSVSCEVFNTDFIGEKDGQKEEISRGILSLTIQLINHTECLH